MRIIRIAICDRSRKDREYYASRCRELGQSCSLNLRIRLYESSSDLFFDLDSPKLREDLDILFLEADAPEYDGIETAFTLRQIGYSGQIIFLAHKNPGDRIEEIFETQGSGYLLKRVPDHFESVFHRAIDTVMELREEYVLYNRVGEYRQIAISEILYFDLKKNQVCVHYNQEYFEFLSTLKKVQIQLSERGFCRIHRLYVVSLDHVRRLTYTEAELSDGTKLPVGRTYYAAFKEALENWRRSESQEESI